MFSLCFNVAVNDLLTKIPTLNDKISEVVNLTSNFSPISNISENIKKIKDLIEQARDAANRVRVRSPSMLLTAIKSQVTLLGWNSASFRTA